MTYDEIIEQLEVTKSKIKEIARSEYGGESMRILITKECVAITKAKQLR